MKSLFSLIFFLLLAYHGQTQCLPQTQAYQAGEELWYDVKYNWGVLWVDAGETMFKVENAKWEGLDAYWFKAYGRSLKKWDWMYKVRDTFDAIGTQGQLKPEYFRRNTNEGGYKVDNKYWFNHEENTIKTSVYNSDDGQQAEEFIKNENCVWDLLSAVYYARNLNYSDYYPHEKIPFNLIVDGKVYNLWIRYLGRAELEMPDGKKYNTIKFSALLVDGTIFDGGEDMTVWVSADENKIPLKVQAKIKVGWVKAFLRSTKGLKYDGITSLNP